VEDWDLPTFTPSVFSDSFSPSPEMEGSQTQMQTQTQTQQLQQSGPSFQPAAPQPLEVPNSASSFFQNSGHSPQSSQALLASPTAPALSLPSASNLQTPTSPNMPLTLSAFKNSPKPIIPLPSLIPGSSSMAVMNQSSSEEIAELKQKNQQLESMLTMVYNMYLQQEEKLTSLSQQMDRLQISASLSPNSTHAPTSSIFSSIIPTVGQPQGLNNNNSNGPMPPSILNAQRTSPHPPPTQSHSPSSGNRNPPDFSKFTTSGPNDFLKR